MLANDTALSIIILLDLYLAFKMIENGCHPSYHLIELNRSECFFSLLGKFSKNSKQHKLKYKLT